MGNPLYGSNKTDNFLDGQEKMVKLELNNGVAITAVTHAAGDHGFQWKNPEGEDIIVTDCVIDVSTAATGTPTMDVGVAANGTTTSDTIMDAVAVGDAADISTLIAEAGTNGKGAVKMSSTQWITGDGSKEAGVIEITGSSEEVEIQGI